MPDYDIGKFMEAGGKFAFEILSEQNKHKKKLDQIKAEAQAEAAKQNKIAETSYKQGVLQTVGNLYQYLPAEEQASALAGMGLAQPEPVYPQADARRLMGPTVTPGRPELVGRLRKEKEVAAKTKEKPLSPKDIVAMQKNLIQMEKIGLDIQKLKDELKYGRIEPMDILIVSMMSQMMKQVAPNVDMTPIVSSMNKMLQAYYESKAKGLEGAKIPTEGKHKVGDTITVGGKTRKIIRMDKDGTPMVRDNKGKLRRVISK